MVLLNQFERHQSYYLKMKHIISLALLLAVATAIPFKKDDYESRMKQAEADAKKDLYEFLAAYKADDAPILAYLTEPIIKIAESGKKHSEELIPKLQKVQEKLTRVSELGHSVLMKALAFLIDGNRDNKSYTDLETIIQWTRLRINRNATDPHLAGANVAAKQSQDCLQLMAGTFVEGIKTMKKDLSNMHEINVHTGQVFANNKDCFLDKFDEALANLKAFRDDVQTKSAVLDN